VDYTEYRKKLSLQIDFLRDYPPLQAQCGKWFLWKKKAEQLAPTGTVENPRLLSKRGLRHYAQNKDGHDSRWPRSVNFNIGKGCQKKGTILRFTIEYLEGKYDSCTMRYSHDFPDIVSNKSWMVLFEFSIPWSLNLPNQGIDISHRKTGNILISVEFLPKQSNKVTTSRCPPNGTVEVISQIKNPWPPYVSHLYGWLRLSLPSSRSRSRCHKNVHWNPRLLSTKQACLSAIRAQSSRQKSTCVSGFICLQNLPNIWQRTISNVITACRIQLMPELPTTTWAILAVAETKKGRDALKSPFSFSPRPSSTETLLPLWRTEHSTTRICSFLGSTNMVAHSLNDEGLGPVYAVLCLS